MKTCTQCSVEKSKNEFSKRKSRKDGLRSSCKNCDNISSKTYHHSKNGLISKIYSHQKETSKKRGHIPPTYTKQELKEWTLQNNKFDLLFDLWKKNNFTKNTTPSIDRKDDYKPYSLNNIQFMTWNNNNKKGAEDRINGINNKANKTVVQYTLNNTLVKEYYSISEARRQTKIHHISTVCSGKREVAGGYKWKYKKET